MFQSLYAVTSVMFLSSSAFGFDFSAADELFTRRAESVATIQNAIESYRSIPVESLSTDENIYAVEQVGALYVYWGYVFDQADTRGRVAIADRCISHIEKIKPGGAIPANPQYYYWRAACMMARGNAAGITASLSQAQAVLDTIDAGRRIDPSYEGGGFDRLSGVLYAKLPSFNPFGPSGDMNRALREFRRAIDSPAYIHPLNPSWRDSDSESGELFYSTHFYYGEALLANGQRAEAKALVEQALADIDQGLIARGREPECQVAKANLKGLLAKIAKN